MPWLSAAKVALREEARRANGEFGTQSHLTAGIPQVDSDLFGEPWATVPHEPLALDAIPHLEGNPQQQAVEHLEMTLMSQPWCDADAVDSLHDLRQQAVERKLARLKIDPEESADPTEWQHWIEKERAYATQRGDTQALTTLEGLSKSGVPTNAEFQHCQLAMRQASTVPQSMSREVRQIAGILDISTDDAQEVFLTARRDYQLQGGTATAPEWFTSGLTASYRFQDAIKHPPTDHATQWALHEALTNPSRSAHCARLDSGYVVFDTETNGLHSKADILSITVRQYTADGALVDELSTYVQPPKSADGTFDLGDEKCRSIHGISAEHVATAPTFADIGGRVRELMAGRTLVGHNIVSFDIPKVQSALSRNGHDPLPRSPMVDTLRLARWKQPNPGVPSKEWRHTLEHACRRAGVAFDTDKAHDASYDVDRSQALFAALMGECSRP